ncbi:MAG: MBL fold metallo-hydrolase [Saprospiraceae bacterium]
MVRCNDNVIIFQSALYKTNSVVIGFKDVVFIIDPGCLPNEVRIIKEFVDEAYPNSLKVVIYTHADFDHIIGHFAFVDAVNIASFSCNKRLLTKKPLQEMVDFYQSYYIDIPNNFGNLNIDHTIHFDYQILHINDVDLVFYLMDGHTQDGLSIYFPSMETLVVGDYVSDLECPWIEDTLTNYHLTLDKLQIFLSNYPIQTCIPGHGNPYFDKKDILRRIDIDKEYLRMLEGVASMNEIQSFLSKMYSPNPKLMDIHKANILKLNK